MDSYALAKRWRQFSRSVPLREALGLRKKILQEVSARNYDRIKDWMRDASPRDYALGQLFGEDDESYGDMRVAFPLTTKEERTAAEMMAALLENGPSHTGVALMGHPHRATVNHRQPSRSVVATVLAEASIVLRPELEPNSRRKPRAPKSARRSGSPRKTPQRFPIEPRRKVGLGLLSLSDSTSHRRASRYRRTVGLQSARGESESDSRKRCP